MDNKRLIRKLAWVVSLGAMLSLSSCSAPGDTPPGSPSAAATDAMPAASPVTQPVSVPTPAAAPSKPVSDPMPGPEGKPTLLPPALGADPGRTCRSDSDCAMKDGGSCCGYRPVCVNKDTPTFPEKVKAACAEAGRVGICGFPAIEGCQCVAGKCEGVLMMENSVPLQ